MGKTRFLLLLVFTVFGSLGLFLWSRELYEFAILISPVPMVSSLLLFLFSFFEVDRTSSGELYFKESNPYLRLMRYVFSGCDSLKVGQISICKLHGLSMLLVVLGAIAGSMVFVSGNIAVFVFVIMPITSIMDKYSVAVWWAVLYYFGFVLAIVGAVVAVVLLVMAAVKYVPAFKETWLGQIFLSAYNSLCPMIRLEFSEKR